MSYADDSAVHEQMVRFATLQFQAGQLPLTSWFPYIGLGSPQFLHYQSLPAMITGLIGVITGPDSAFRWTLYVLLSAWPLSVYVSARLFGARRPGAAMAAAMSPFVVSATGLGYEQHAYVWLGLGLWTQLWASLTLPLAWGFSWRAIRDGRGFGVAVASVSLTAALHFETGYLAIIPLVLWPLVGSARPIVRLRRGGVLIGGSLLASAWVIVPLVDQREWAARNEILSATPLVNGYGAHRVLVWLFSGQLLDYGRIPVLTVFVVVGFGLAVARWRSDVNARALVVAFVACLLLSFGRTTWGALIDVIPGAGDIFFRRFMMGIQLAGLLLAGLAAEACARAIEHELSAWLRRRRGDWSRRRGDSMHRRGGARILTAPRRRALRLTVACGTAIVMLAPAWTQFDAYDSGNAAEIAKQRRADATQGAQVDRLIDFVRRAAGGRVYAGMPSNWGAAFGVGAVPVYKYLESRDVDEVGDTLRTASLMTDPEYYFDEDDPSDYSLFGIGYLILPLGRPAPVPARLIMRAGIYCLWKTGTPGYVRVGRLVGAMTADRTDVGARSIPLLQSHLAQSGGYLRVAFGGGPTTVRPVTRMTPVRLPAAPGGPPAGTVLAERDRLEHGEVTATVTMHRAGVAVLSASFDPGWTATVDGRSRATLMVAPALVATAVPAGTHTVSFRYHGFGDYAALFALGAVCLGALLVIDLRLRHR
ncbi:MAG: YfhO family protein [Solirubrobacteraceae bacterium]